MQPDNLKPGLHLRNLHRELYPFEALMAAAPALAPYVSPNAYGNLSIDFFDPLAVKALNRALLIHYYQLRYWDIPAGYLCPPVPGRADYIHHLADLLAAGNRGQIPTGSHIKCLDIGVGANCIYPIIGHRSYGWSFVGADTDAVAVGAAQNIVENNPVLAGAIAIRHQANPQHIFAGIVGADERFDITLCNPPFHASAEEAQAGSRRKVSNLKGKPVNRPVLNFAGQSHELWCPGGELAFVSAMIEQSKAFKAQCGWFTSLVSRESSLKGLMAVLKRTGAAETRIIPMHHGNKVSRILAWRF